MCVQVQICIRTYLSVYAPVYAQYRWLQGQALVYPVAGFQLSSSTTPGPWDFPHFSKMGGLKVGRAGRMGAKHASRLGS